MSKVYEAAQDAEKERLEFAEKELDHQEVYDSLKADLKRNSRGYVKLQELKEKMYATHF